MQTFLPYQDFKLSAECLDNKRLGKQRVEVWQIYLALTQENYGWKNHPIVKMWKGYENSLIEYGLNICKEWIKRGFKDNMAEKFLTIKTDFVNKITKYPLWLGKKEIHSSHRAALLFKNYEWYKQFNWKEEPKIEYYWEN